MIQLRRPTEHLTQHRATEVERLQIRLHEMGYSATKNDIVWAYVNHCSQHYGQSWINVDVMELDKACYAVKGRLEEVE